MLKPEDKPHHLCITCALSQITDIGPSYVEISMHIIKQVKYTNSRFLKHLPLFSLHVDDNDLRQEPARFAPFARIVVPDF